jgi:hypothetical protein
MDSFGTYEGIIESPYNRLPCEDCLNNGKDDCPVCEMADQDPCCNPACCYSDPITCCDCETTQPVHEEPVQMYIICDNCLDHGKWDYCQTCRKATYAGCVTPRCYYAEPTRCCVCEDKRTGQEVKKPP